MAKRKAESLVAAGARVILVAEECSDPPRGVELVLRAFQEGDLEGMALIFAATSDRSVNASIARTCMAKNLWVNAVDDPEACRFILPAVVHRGDVVLAVSTGGQSPLLARRIKERLEGLFGPEYGPLASLLGEMRRAWLRDPRIAHLSFEERKEVWERVLDLPLAEWVREGATERLRQSVDGILSASLPGEGQPPPG